MLPDLRTGHDNAPPEIPSSRQNRPRFPGRPPLRVDRTSLQAHGGRASTSPEVRSSHPNRTSERRLSSARDGVRFPPWDILAPAIGAAVGPSDPNHPIGSSPNDRTSSTAPMRTDDREQWEAVGKGQRNEAHLTRASSGPPGTEVLLPLPLFLPPAIVSQLCFSTEPLGAS